MISGSEPRELYLSKVQAKNTGIIIVTNGGIELIFSIVYFWMKPFPLIIRTVSDLRFPLSLSKEPKGKHGISIFPFFSCNQKDQSIYKDNCVLRHKDSEQDSWNFFSFL